MIGAAALAEENAIDMAPLCEWRDNVHPNALAIIALQSPRATICAKRFGGTGGYEAGALPLLERLFSRLRLDNRVLPPCALCSIVLHRSLLYRPNK
jgi:hypothetical protein